ncbi:MAG: gliding motility-associated C-terminal domain-containing protein [Bacteroidetes bacterium]|nr:gliding motility-associated C-terminal domain-containing protein [Bacteroidota bacterium]
MLKRPVFTLILLFVIGFVMVPNTSRATHAAGGEVVYEHLGDSTYRIFLKFYRDCTGVGAGTTQQLCISNTCTSSSLTVTMGLWTNKLPDGRDNGTSLSAGCSAYKNTCDSPASKLPGYQEWWYYYDYTLPFRCDHWTFSSAVSARNNSNNLAGATGQAIYLEATFNNNLFVGTPDDTRVNFSPYFSVKPIPYVSLNQPYTFNNGAIDPNANDSLVTEIIQPMTGSVCGPGSVIPWFVGPTPAYSIPLNPFQTNNSFVLNAATGQMSFTPTQITGPSVLTTRVKEYRKGQLIGWVIRDVQIQVVTGGGTAPNLFYDFGSFNNCTWNANKVNGCADLPMSFDFYIKHTDPTTVFILEDNHALAIPSSVVTYTNQKSDSIRGNFSWTPTVPGSYNFIVTAKDSTCKPPGIMLYYSFSIPIYIWGPTVALRDTSICPGETAYLTATGGSNYVWGVLPGGSPVTSLSCTNCTSPVATPLLHTFYTVTSTANTVCPNNKDTVEVNVLPGLSFIPIKDTVTCPDNPIVLNPKINPPIGVTYTAKWKPSTYLDDSTKIMPKSTPKKTVTYILTLSSSANQCKGYDTVVVDVLTGFKIQNPDTAICDGGQVQVRATGDSRYTFKWDATGVPGVFSNPDVLNPTITPTGIGTNKYTLKATFGNCLPDSSSFKIDLQPIPTVKVDDDAQMCFGDTMQLHSFILPANYPFMLSWTPGAQLDNPNIANPIFKANQTNTLTLTASTTAGCKGSDDVFLKVLPAKFLNELRDTAICPGEELPIHLTGVGVKSMRWYPDYRISDPTSYNPTVTPAATTTYYAVGVDTNSCNDTSAIKVVVHPKPLVDIPDSVRIYPGESYHIEPGGNCTYFNWFPPIGLNKATISNPVAKPDVNTLYTVTARTEQGCTTTNKINIFVSIESILDVPNAFAPGSENGTFKVMRKGDATLKNFAIYNRWGQKVFETNDINKGWDGKYKDEAQPMGVYVYTVEAVTPTGRVFSKQGNLTLIR